MTLRNRAIFKGILIVLILCVFIWVSSEKKKHDLRQFDNFYNTSLNGKIILIEARNHGVGFKLNNLPEEFVFFPIGNEILNHYTDFYITAKIGDVVIKKSNSDTLLLLHKDSHLRYTFQK